MSKIIFYRQIIQKGWGRVLLWGIIKSALEGVAYFLEIRDVWMRISIGLIWLGVITAGFPLFLATRQVLTLPDEPSRRIRICYILQIIGLFLLIVQLPMLSLAFFFSDGLITLASTAIFALSGYLTTSELRKAVNLIK